MSRYLGGGRQSEIRFDTNGADTLLKVRMGIFGANLGVIRYPYRLRGKIIVRSKNRWIAIDTIYGALRRAYYMLFTYGLGLHEGEKLKMAKLLKNFDDFNDLIISGCSLEEFKTYERKLKAAGAATRNLLGRVINPHKKNIFLHIGSLELALDNAGRRNPGAKLAILQAAHNQRNNRLQQITCIDTRIRDQEASILQLILWAQFIVDKTESLVDKLIRKQVIQATMPLERRRMIAARLMHCYHDLLQLDFHPFLMAAQLSARDISRACQLLRMKNFKPSSRDETHWLFRKCRTALRIKQTQVELERSIYRAMLSEQNDVQNFPCSSLIRDLELVSKKLSAIKDRNLDAPVCSSAKAHLRAAIVHLRKPNPINFLLAQDIIREASATL